MVHMAVENIATRNCAYKAFLVPTPNGVEVKWTWNSQNGNCRTKWLCDLTRNARVWPNKAARIEGGHKGDIVGLF